MSLVKASITNLESNEQIPCLFNPTEYTIAKSNQWKVEPVIGENVPPPVFTGGDAMTLRMTLFFDTYHGAESEKTDVREYTDKLLQLMYVDPQTRNDKNKKGRPPMVQFNWGKAWGFKAIITQMTQRFTLFLDSGVPVRATVEIAFQQVAQQGSYPPQNSTSQSVPGRRIRTVERGDRIDLIAYQEYGQASQWKHIAEVNGLVDPLSLTPGQRLIIEPL